MKGLPNEGEGRDEHFRVRKQEFELRSGRELKFLQLTVLSGIAGDRRSSKGTRRDENAKVCIVQSIRGGGGAGRRLMEKCLSASVEFCSCSGRFGASGVLQLVLYYDATVD